VSLLLENGPALAIVMTIINTWLANTLYRQVEPVPTGPGDRGSLRSGIDPKSARDLLAPLGEAVVGLVSDHAR
jgi:hypothetical protein